MDKKRRRLREKDETEIPEKKKAAFADVSEETEVTCCPCGGGQSCIVDRRECGDFVHEDVVLFEAGLPRRTHCLAEPTLEQQAALRAWMTGNIRSYETISDDTVVDDGTPSSSTGPPPPRPIELTECTLAVKPTKAAPKKPTTFEQQPRPSAGRTSLRRNWRQSFADDASRAAVRASSRENDLSRPPGLDETESISRKAGPQTSTKAAPKKPTKPDL